MNRILLMLLVAALAGCVSEDDASGNSTDVPGQGGGTDSEGAQGNSTGQSGSSGDQGQDGTAVQCDGETQTTIIWELPEDYDATGDSGDEVMEWADSVVKFRLLYGNARSGDLSVAILKDGDERWSGGSSGTMVSGSGNAGPQSGAQRLEGPFTVQWSANGSFESVQLEAEYQSC